MKNCYNRTCCCNNFIPVPGPTGPAGNSATIAIGSTTTGEPGTNAIVTNSGTTSNAVLNFVIPRGESGTNDTIKNIDSGNFISRTNATYNSPNSIINLPITLNSNNITTNSNSIISVSKNGRYLINYGIKSTTSGNIIGLYINGNNNINTNLETTQNNLNQSTSIILYINENDVITLGAVNANETLPLTLENNTINAYITIISLD